VPLSFTFEPYDFLENIAGFAPIGLVLGEMGFFKAVLIGAAISTGAEFGQFFMMHRDPSTMDVLANVLGTVLGAVISARWHGYRPWLRIGRWKAIMAAAVALVVIAGVARLAGDPINGRGLTAPGALEAWWKFDDPGGLVAIDYSGHGLNGTLHTGLRRVAGFRGGAVALDGTGGYIDAGHSSAFRLAGSMTISAWINSSSFPKDDAAIVSQMQNGSGYQLDTTVDRQLRGIGFKLTNSCGKLMARYGATPLAIGAWYHVAGVYDAEARSLDVYLNGKLDNGFPAGTVTGIQRSSLSPVYIGRRTDASGYEFAGSIDDVRIYSFALTREEVAADMHGEVIRRAAGIRRSPPHAQADTCSLASEYEDSKIPLMAAILGVLAAVACVGFLPSDARLPCMIASLAAGLCLLPLMAPTVPSITRLMMPLVSLAGGVSVAVSLREATD
jgi:hypothetical protein